MKWLCILFVLFLSGCRTDHTITEEDMMRLLEDKNLQNDVLTVSKKEGNFERLEMINAEDRTAIHIHIIDFESGRDVQYFVTPEWIYQTDTMTKHMNPYDARIDTEFKALLEHYTELLADAFYTKEMIVDIALSLHQTHYYKGSTAIIRGVNPDQRGVQSGQVRYVEIHFRDSLIKELHFRLEYHVDSTKKESNYISGTHYYFSDELVLTFPDLSQFSEAES